MDFTDSVELYNIIWVGFLWTGKFCFSDINIMCYMYDIIAHNVYVISAKFIHSNDFKLHKKAMFNIHSLDSNYPL